MNKCLEKRLVRKSVYLEYIVFDSRRLISFGSLKWRARVLEQLVMRLKVLVESARGKAIKQIA